MAEPQGFLIMSKTARFGIAFLSVLLLLALVGPLLVPVPPIGGTVPARQLADADSRFVEISGLDVHYKAAGAGQPVLVLLHGFGASTFTWQEVTAPLSEVGTVLAFDRPAFGLTERPLPGEWEGDNPYSPENQADLTIALLDQFGIREATLVGHSAGGTVATLTALRHPQRIAALVLVAPAIYAGVELRGGSVPCCALRRFAEWDPCLSG
jgi:pimeloyl-ACP methyl ester carboxylesterase